MDDYGILVVSSAMLSTIATDIVLVVWMLTAVLRKNSVVANGSIEGRYHRC